MNGIGQNLPYWAQSVGLAASVLGAGIACVAARRAKGAREQAEMAKQAATRLGRVAQLSDLIADMRELDAMLARADFPAIGMKANLLRGRIARFKTEAYTELGGQEREDLDLAREQLQAITKVAVGRTFKDETRKARIPLGYGNAYEALNRVFAIHGQAIVGD